jgi:hypothetical protein
MVTEAFILIPALRYMETVRKNRESARNNHRVRDVRIGCVWLVTAISSGFL